MNPLTGHLDELGRGLVTTVELTVVTSVAALLLGIVVATLRIAPVPLLRAVGTVYVEVLQNLPLLALLVLFVFAFPTIGITFPLFTSAAIVISFYEGAYVAEAIRAGINTVAVGQAEAGRAIGITFPLFTSAAIVISCYEGAYVAEAIRAGINTVAVGQAEAARAIGLTFSQSLRHVILPQALRAVVQPLGNIYIALLMNTSLAAGVGIVELTQAANNVNLVEAQPIVVFTGAGVVYMILALGMGYLTGRIERKFAIIR